MFSAYTDRGFQFQTYDGNDADHQHGGFDELLLAIQLMPGASSNMGQNISGPLRDPPPLPPPPPQQEMQEVQVVAGSGSGRKRGLRRDRHSKIVTAKGPRDRRMRLSLDVAKKFFYLQDVLGFDKASKTVDWLLTKSNDAIRSLTSCASGSGSQCRSHLEEEEEEEGKIVDSAVITPTGTKPLTNRKATSNPALVRESRAKARARARERARERTREKKISMSMAIHHQHQHESSMNVDYPLSFFQEFAGGNSCFHQQQQQEKEEEEEEEEEQEGGVLHPYFL